MKITKTCLPLLALTIVGTLAGCSKTSQTKAVDVTDSIRTSLDQAGLKKVTANQDRDKGVVTLGGSVNGDGDKSQAESIARSFAGGQVIANEIAVIPPGAESDAKKVNSDLDKGIESNLDAVLVADKLNGGVKFSAKNRVVTLTGDVDSQGKRAYAAKEAASVPNVQQVVNELQVKGQKASSN